MKHVLKGLLTGTTLTIALTVGGGYIPALGGLDFALPVMAEEATTQTNAEAGTEATTASPETDFTFDSTTGTITGYTGSDTDVVVPDTIGGVSVTVIGDKAFYKCESLTSIILPDSITTIETSAFNRCSSLTSITLPKELTTIGKYAFVECKRLTSITLPEKLTTIEWGAFERCEGLTSITLPKSLTTIGDYAFSGLSMLKNITIPEGVTTIGWGAFDACTGLTNIEVDANNPIYKSIDGVLFNKTGATLITCPGGKTGEYVIPDGVTSIEGSAFHKCESLTIITIPKDLTTIGEFAFEFCTGLTNIEVDANNPAYKSIDGVLFNKACTTLITCPAGKTGEYIIPDGVTSIEMYAFDACISLTSIIIPNRVITINEGTFCGCTGLTNISIPDSVTTIGYYAFEDCSSLTHIRIPNGVTTIEDSAFDGCSSLTGITIPNGVTTIGSNVFLNCSSLTHITIPGSVTEIGKNSLYYCTALTDVYCYINTVADNANHYPTITKISYIGDINGDKLVDNADARLMLKEGYSTSSVSHNILDYNMDGDTNILDTIALLKDVG